MINGSTEADEQSSAKLRLGVIGLGAIGQEMLSAAAGHPDVQVVHVADLDERRRKVVAESHPGLRTTTDAAQVIEDAAIDVVYVATPPRTHAGLVAAALERGLHVLCEKPLAISLDEGREMASSASSAKSVTAVNFSLSDRHAVLRLDEALSSGEVGDVVAVDIRFSFPAWPRDFQAEAAWLDGAEQGGFLREVLSHYVYLTDRLLGPLTVAQAAVELGAGPDRAETAASGLLRAGDVPVRVSAQVSAGPQRYEWTLWGRRRSFRLVNWATLEVTDGDTWAPVELSGPLGTEETRLSRFANAVRTGRYEHLASFADALRVQEVIETFRAGVLDD